LIAVAPDDARYPARLRDLARPPDPLWIDGDESALGARCVAIVGTRRMTGYGERVAREIAGACASAGVVVVSGLAQGIDSAAHRGALDAGGRTVAVLGEGIGLFLATVRGRRRPLTPRIRANGALISEYPPSLCARPWTFAKRNATIAALAEAVAVIEAGERSGALITAADARRLGRPLFAVPGPLGSAASVGTNMLIATEAARALISAAALLDAVGVMPRAIEAVSRDPVLDALSVEPLDIDALLRRCGHGGPALDAALARLLLAGEVVVTRDGRYRRT
jgi:DNA processing protein